MVSHSLLDFHEKVWALVTLFHKMICCRWPQLQ